MPQRAPAGYRFLRAVLIIGAVGFGALGVFYLANGQIVPGVFALFLAIAEALALPLFRKLLESSHPREASSADTDQQTTDRTKT